MKKGKSGEERSDAKRGKTGNYNITVERKSFVKWLAAALLAVMTSGFTPCGAAQAEETNLDLYARGAVLMDADSGRVLYGKEEDTVLPMASTTKIMTCILALERGNPEDEVEATSYAASQPQVRLGMSKGDRFYLKDLLYSLMLESHNDSAVAIAEHIGGSVEGFAELMNEKAEEIGCTDTHFITPNGLDAAEIVDGVEVRHSTTAEDLARIMRYCIMISPQREMFLEITGTPNYSFANRQGSRSYSCTNHNAFLGMMDGALSGKTGFTGGAGYCYVGALRRDERTFIVALLACGWPNHRTYKWIDTRKLMEYGIKNYSYQNVYQKLPKAVIRITGGAPAGDKYNPYEEVTVEAQIRETGAEQAEELNFLLCPEDEVKIDVFYAEELEAPVSKGMKAGGVVYKVNGEPLKEYELVLKEDVARKDLRYMGRYILQEFLLAG